MIMSDLTSKMTMFFSSQCLVVDTMKKIFAEASLESCPVSVTIWFSSHKVNETFISANIFMQH